MVLHKSYFKNSEFDFADTTPTIEYINEIPFKLQSDEPIKLAKFIELTNIFDIPTLHFQFDKSVYSVIKGI